MRNLKIGNQANPNPPGSNQKASLERGDSQQLSDKNMQLMGKKNKATGKNYSYDDLVKKQKAEDNKVKKIKKVGPNSTTPITDSKPAKFRVNSKSGEMEAY
jgi:hypothetical protein